MNRLEALEITKQEFIAERDEAQKRVLQLDDMIATLDFRIASARMNSDAKVIVGSDASDRSHRHVAEDANSMRLKDLCAQIIKQKGPMTTEKLYEELTSMGRKVSSPASVYGTIFREKGKLFKRERGKWFVIS